MNGIGEQAVTDSATFDENKVEVTETQDDRVGEDYNCYQQQRQPYNQIHGFVFGVNFVMNGIAGEAANDA